MSPSESTEEQLKRAQEVQEKYSHFLMDRPHVVGVAIGFRSRRDDDTAAEEKAERPEREVCLVVMVDELISNESLPPSDRIPESLEGVPVEVQLTGLFSAGFSTE
ncbi:MAG: hypothetical protein IPK19_14920 [Chloroflexi bacterium]|nr:hypothetical protein [Chloroflexota bacterium]